MDESDSFVQREMSPLGQSLRVNEELYDLWGLPLRAPPLPQATVDKAVAVLLPVINDAVSWGELDPSDLADLSEGVPLGPRFGERGITKVHHIGLDVLAVIAPQDWVPGLRRFLLQLHWVFELSELLKELYHVAHICLTTFGWIKVHLIWWLKISVSQSSFAWGSGVYWSLWLRLLK